MICETLARVYQPYLNTLNPIVFKEYLLLNKVLIVTTTLIVH